LSGRRSELWSTVESTKEDHSNAVRSTRLYLGGRVDARRGRESYRGTAEAGLDFVEIPLLRPESMDVTATRALLDRYGIGCTCSLGLPKAAHLPSAPEKAELFLESAVDVAAGLEAPVISVGRVPGCSSTCGAISLPVALILAVC
jgi:hypothetical protein